MSARTTAKDLVRRLPHPLRHRLRQLARWERGRRIVRPVRWGSLRRTRPVSSTYGRDRGTSVDRVFLERFFAAHADDIRGAVLEVDRAAFSAPFGRGVTSTDILDIDPRNDLATIVADLAVPGVLPRDEFDCIIVPQTLQYVADPATAVRSLHDALRPGGVLLVTMPTIAKIDQTLVAVDAWRVTPVGLRIALERWCPDAEVTVESAGNVLVATAFLQGVAAEELRAEEFDVVDPMYPILAMAVVRRAGTA